MTMAAKRRAQCDSRVGTPLGSWASGQVGVASEREDRAKRPERGVSQGSQMWSGAANGVDIGAIPGKWASDLPCGGR